MKSRRDVEQGAEAEDAAIDEEEHLLVPAGPARVALGIVMFVAGILAAMRYAETWLILVGIGAFLLSFPAMLKSPEGE